MDNSLITQNPLNDYLNPSRQRDSIIGGGPETAIILTMKTKQEPV